MNTNGIYKYIIGVILCMATLWGTCSCTDDSAPDGQVSEHLLHLTMGTQSYGALTRGLPDGYSAYNHASALAPITQIQAYLTYQKNGSGEAKYIPCLFNYSQESTDPQWTSRVALDENASYYLYGFMPKESGGSTVSIAPYDDDDTDDTPADYAKGAVLTFSNLNVVTPDDICIIAGAEGYGSTAKPSIPDMAARLGQFGYKTDDGDNLFLLVNHIYSGMEFNMKVTPAYNALRTIKVKSITLKPDATSGAVVERINATVKIVQNNTGSNPISVSFSAPTSSTTPQPAVLYDGVGKELTTDYQSFLACLCPVYGAPGGNYILETTYDVYDKSGSGTPIREGEKARNVITHNGDIASGKKYTVNITVNPTYLYMLSEPDLDSPTFTVN